MTVREAANKMPDDAAKLRMATVLGTRRDAEGGYAALARSIRAAYVAAFPGDSPGVMKNGKPRDVVDRRKLATIVDGVEELVFTTRELRALDLYLERYHEGLSVQPLFEKPSLIQTLAQSGTVTFLLGSRPDDESVMSFPHWDVLAMAEIQRRLTAMKMPVAIDIQDVPMPATPGDADSANREIAEVESDRMEPPAWRARFESRRTLVCLGSDRRMPASGSMLHAMFDLDRTDPDELPFRFVWSERVHAEPSPFRLAARDIEQRDPAAATATLEHGASALVLPDSILLDTLTADKQGEGYGLCVAQRREDGVLWVLIAGISGPATYATACLLHRIPIHLSAAGADGRSPVWWSAVRAAVPGDRDTSIESRRELSPTIVVDPTPWEPRGSQSG